MINSSKAIAFFSGFPNRRFTDEIARRLAKELPVRHRIVFITACPEDCQRNDEDSAGMHGMFVEYGIGFDRFCVVDNRTDFADAQEWVSPPKPTVIPIPAGLQYRGANHPPRYIRCLQNMFPGEAL